MIDCFEGVLKFNLVIFVFGLFFVFRL